MGRFDAGAWLSRRLDNLNLARFGEAIVSSRSLLPRVMSRSGWSTQPVHLLLETTYHCNLRCSFCQYLNVIDGSASAAGPVRRHTPEDLRRIVAGFKRGRLITFSGGEVFSQRSFIKLVEDASRTHRIHIITNGTYLDEETVDRLVAAAPRHFWGRGLVLMDLSIQGSETTHDRTVDRPGSHAKASAGLVALLERRADSNQSMPKVNLKMVITSDTVGEIVDFVEWGVSLGVDVISLMALHNVIPHSGELIGGDGLARIGMSPPSPTGVDPALLRRQMIRAFQVAEGTKTQIRTSPPNLPIDEFVRLYTDDDHLDPDEFRCRVPWFAQQLTADGTYSLCPYLRIGDSSVQSPGDAWNSPEFREFRRELRSAKVFPGCRGCCGLQYHGSLKEGLAGVSVDDLAAANSPEVDGARVQAAAAMTEELTSVPVHLVGRLTSPEP